MKSDIRHRFIILTCVTASLCGGCAWRHVEHRQINGVDCAVTVNEISGNESQPNCDWPDR